MIEIDKKIIIATKWSIFTELTSKLVQPVINIILARILTPDDFGIIATIIMIISFTDMFTDAGFQKYLIQHYFTTEDDFDRAMDVAFWSNLFISIFIWLLIYIKKDSIANLVGNPKMGNTFFYAAVSLPITAFSSIQLAYFHKNLEFKTLYEIKIKSLLIPIFITVPLAFILKNYWAVIIGTLVTNLFNSVMLNIKSRWKPKLYFSIRIFKEMFSFSCLILGEQILVWLNSYIGTFLVATKLTTYYLGIYKTAMMTVNQITMLITSAITPVLFSALSQNGQNEYKKIFIKFQKIISIIILPMGIGIFLFSDVITAVLLGEQWKEAVGFMSFWGLFSCMAIVFGQMNSELYRAKGKPELSLIVQVLNLIILIPALLISVNYNFRVLYITRSVVRIQAIIINLFLLRKYYKITPLNQIMNVYPYLLSSVLMGLFSILVSSFFYGLWNRIILMFLCAIFYFILLLIIPDSRKYFIYIFKCFKKKLF